MFIEYWRHYGQFVQVDVAVDLCSFRFNNKMQFECSMNRFIYWRICCFVCTREPKRRRIRRNDFQRSLSQPSRTASARPSIRRSVRVSQRTTDSGIDSYCEPHMTHAHSDTELRWIISTFSVKKLISFRPFGFRYSGNERNQFDSKRRSQRFSRHRNRDRFRQDRHTVERDRNVDRLPCRPIAETNPRFQVPKIRTESVRGTRSQSLARGEAKQQKQQQQSIATDNAARHIDQTMTLPSSFRRNKHTRNGKNRIKSRIRRLPTDKNMIISFFFFFSFFCIENRARSVDPSLFVEAPVLCNRYAIEELNRTAAHDMERRKHRARSMPRTTANNYNDLMLCEPPASVRVPKRLQANERYRYLAPPLPPETYDDEFIEMETPMRRVKRREKALLPPSPRIMSPMGFAINRQARLQHYDEESMYDDEWIDYHSDMPVRVRPVPLWLCVFLVVGYIIAGAFYFSETENWVKFVCDTSIYISELESR